MIETRLDVIIERLADPLTRWLLFGCIVSAVYLTIANIKDKKAKQNRSRR